MEDQMFLFTCTYHRLVIGAQDETEARDILYDFLKEHPNMPGYWTPLVFRNCQWTMTVCGKLTSHIFSLPDTF